MTKNLCRPRWAAGRACVLLVLVVACSAGTRFYATQTILSDGCKGSLNYSITALADDLLSRRASFTACFEPMPNTPNFTWFYYGEAPMNDTEHGGGFIQKLRCMGDCRKIGYCNQSEVGGYGSCLVAHLNMQPPFPDTVVLTASQPSCEQKCVVVPATTGTTGAPAATAPGVSTASASVNGSDTSGAPATTVNGSDTSGAPATTVNGSDTNGAPATTDALLPAAPSTGVGFPGTLKCWDECHANCSANNFIAREQYPLNQCVTSPYGNLGFQLARHQPGAEQVSFYACSDSQCQPDSCRVLFEATVGTCQLASPVVLPQLYPPQRAVSVSVVVTPPSATTGAQPAVVVSSSGTTIAPAAATTDAAGQGTTLFCQPGTSYCPQQGNNNNNGNNNGDNGNNNNGDNNNNGNPSTWQDYARRQTSRVLGFSVVVYIGGVAGAVLIGVGCFIARSVSRRPEKSL